MIELQNLAEQKMNLRNRLILQSLAFPNRSMDFHFNNLKKRKRKILDADKNPKLEI